MKRLPQVVILHHHRCKKVYLVIYYCTYFSAPLHPLHARVESHHPLILSSCHRSTKTHPGPVVHLSDSPKDEGKVSRHIKQTPPCFPEAPVLVCKLSHKFLLPNLLCLSCIFILSFCFYLPLLSNCFHLTLCLTLFQEHWKSFFLYSTSPIVALFFLSAAHFFTYTHERKEVLRSCR